MHARTCTRECGLLFYVRAQERQLEPLWKIYGNSVRLYWLATRWHDLPVFAGEKPGGISGARGKVDSAYVHERLYSWGKHTREGFTAI